VTALQALVLLFLHECVSGRDRIGRTYYLLAMDMWRRLGFNQYNARPYDCEESHIARQDWTAKTVTVWGIFCVEQCVLLPESGHVTFISLTQPRTASCPFSPVSSRVYLPLRWKDISSSIRPRNEPISTLAMVIGALIRCRDLSNAPC
jgi:hypothetical protein